MSVLPKELIEFYLVHGKGDYTWIELADMFNVRPDIKNRESRSDYIRKTLKRLGNVSVSSVWQGGKDGEFKMSFKKDKNVDWSSIKDEVDNWLKNNKESDKKQKVLNPSNEVVWAISDLHFGAITHNGVMSTPVLMDRLNQIKDEVNASTHKGIVNHFVILGDLLETFSGLNRPGAIIDTIEHGVDAVISVYRCLKYFFSQIDSLGNIYITSGNHDRVTGDKGWDPEGGVAKLVSYMLNDSGYYVYWSSTVLSEDIAGCRFIMYHGDKSISSKYDRLVLEYGSWRGENILLQGHLHNGRAKESILMGEGHTKYKHVIVPSLVETTTHAAGLGHFNLPGFAKISFYNGSPRITFCSLSL